MIVENKDSETQAWYQIYSIIKEKKDLWRKCTAQKMCDSFSFKTSVPKILQSNKYVPSIRIVTCRKHVGVHVKIHYNYLIKTKI